ncbi:MAG: hypothetical protein E6Q97_16945 [Desulfurellales bacterium]|nr:MAG: hypothetical protein E6Q97_16945 [Desulfurellales bacterium]
MPRVLLGLVIALALCPPAFAADPVACRLSGGATTTCPGNATLNGTLTAGGLAVTGAGAVVATGGTQTITGAKTFSVAPTMSGANVSSGTVPPSSIQGNASGRVLVDTGTTGAFTNTPVGLTLSGASNTFTNLPAATALSGQVPVANGGTGLAAVFSAGDLLYATGASTLARLGIGTTGQYLGVSSGLPAWRSPVTASASAGTSQTLTTNLWTAITGASVSLSPGLYECTANVRTAVQCTAGTGFISVKLYDVTAAANIPNSERLGTVCSTTGTAYSATTPISELVNINTTSTIQIYAISPAGATYSARDIYSDSDGRTRIVCVSKP